MPVDVTASPSNDLSIAPGVVETGAGTIKISSSGNTLSIAPPLLPCVGLSVDLAGGSALYIEPGCVLNDLKIYARAGAIIRIGASTGFNGNVSLLAHERAEITIGPMCLFAAQTVVTVSDMHSIIDVATGERVNPAASVLIGNHVWVGRGVSILKGATIGEHSVIGAGAVVAGDLPGNSICAGVPARVIRRGITWSHNLL